MRSLHILFAASMGALALPACFVESHPTTTDHGDGECTDTATCLSDVTGTLADTHVVNGGEITRAPDPAKVDLAAMIPHPDGSFHTIQAHVNADGSFTIPGVPYGTYYLRTRVPAGPPGYLVTSERSLDLGRLYLGRPDVALATKPTPVTIDATGLAPWSERDSLRLYSAGAAVSEFLFATQGAPAPGDTSLSGFVYDTLGFQKPALIDDGKGDSALFLQMVTRKTTNGDLEYTTVGSVFTPPPFTQTDGQPTTLSGAFQAAPQTNVSLDVRQSAFAALASQVSPGATLHSLHLIVWAADAGGALPLTGVPPFLLDLTSGLEKDGKLDVSFGNPYPASWRPVVLASGQFMTKLVPPGQPDAAPSSGFVSASFFVDDLAKGPITPRIGPARDVRINGMDASGALAGVGSPVKLSWSAPALGTAGRYAILLLRKEPGSLISGRNIAFFDTTGTEITVPDGLIEPGEVYQFQLIAADTFDPRRPNRGGADTSGAMAPTGYFTR